GFTNWSFSPGAGIYVSQPRNYIGIDNVSWTRGRHVIRFGVEIRRGSFTGDGGGGTGPPLRGTLAYTSGNNAWATVGANKASTILENILTGTTNQATIFYSTST